MLEILKMRLPTSNEYDELVKATNGSDSIMHWSKMASWCQDKFVGQMGPVANEHQCDRPATFWGPAHVRPTYVSRGIISADGWLPDTATNRCVGIGLRPVFEILDADTLIPDGTIITVGTLYMDGQPVKIPKSPITRDEIQDYVLDSKLELREALGSPTYQVQAIKIGCILIADRVLLKNISWYDSRDALDYDDSTLRKMLKIRLPTSNEYDALVKAVGGRNDIMHWKHMYSWCQDVAKETYIPSYLIRGFASDSFWNDKDISYINEDVGFRPIFEILGPDILVPDGTILTVGTLYMNGQPLRVPQVPVYSGDIPNYIPGAKLKIENPLEDPAYQIRAIKIGRILAADRVLLKKISWEDLECQRFC